jgi:hypothetical protein
MRWLDGVLRERARGASAALRGWVVAQAARMIGLGAKDGGAMCRSRGMIDGDAVVSD